MISEPVKKFPCDYTLLSSSHLAASTVGSLKNICRCGIVDYLHRCCSGVHLIDQLPLPNALKK